MEGYHPERRFASRTRSKFAVEEFLSRDAYHLALPRIFNTNAIQWIKVILTISAPVNSTHPRNALYSRCFM